MHARAERGGRVRRAAWMLACSLLLAACASYDGSTLVPGKSTAADVEALMGPPDEKLASAGGSSAWFYTRPSAGLTYAVTLGSDGIVRGVEQRLTEENIAKLEIGVSTQQTVRALFGPPNNTTYFERQQREVWGYKYRVVAERMVLWVRFSNDGVAREVLKSIDWDYIPASRSAAN